MKCDGLGNCLTNPNIICDLDCSLQQCPNFLICGNEEPYFMLIFNNGVCNECFSKFGPCIQNSNPSNPNLIFDYENFDCPICLQYVDVKVKNPRCDHCLCIKCMKGIYFTDIEYPNEPQFPYPNTENEYYEDPNLFLNDIQVQLWKRSIGSWNEERVHYILENRKYLKHCPVCRK